MAKQPKQKDQTFDDLVKKIPQALGDTVLVEQIVRDEMRSVGGIVVSEERKPTDIVLARVVSLGNEAEDRLKVGDVVYVAFSDIEKLGEHPWTDSPVAGFLLEERVLAKA